MSIVRDESIAKSICNVDPLTHNDMHVNWLGKVDCTCRPIVTVILISEAMLVAYVHWFTQPCDMLGLVKCMSRLVNMPCRQIKTGHTIIVLLNGNGGLVLTTKSLKRSSGPSLYTFHHDWYMFDKTMENNELQKARS